MRKLELQEIKDLEYNILVEFDKFCEANHLYYALNGGTLLGAIRHEGFIPWDDDVDVMMPRPDYDRLLHDIEMNYDSLPEYIRVERWTDGTNDYPFIKLVDTRTKLSAEFYDESCGTQNIWIDVFPVDGNCEDDKALDKLHKKELFVRTLLCTKLAKSGEGKSFIKRLMKPVIKFFLLPISCKKLCAYLDKLGKTYDYNSSTQVGLVVWGIGVRERIDKAAFEIPVKVKFEGAQLNAPSNYVEYLTRQFGDYMQLPPEDQRQTHGVTAYMIE